LAAPFAERVFLALPVAGRNGAKYVAVGRPVPARSRAVPRAAARERLGLPAKGPIVLVFGGSLGARLLNELALEAWGDAGRAVPSSSRRQTFAGCRSSSSRSSPTGRGSTRWPQPCVPPHGPMQRRGSPMSSSSSQPLAGRRIWIAGIGGAGMSAYALVAHAWGAEVAGWDRVDTPYLAHLSGIDVAVSPEPPEPPAGWEVYVSTAFAGLIAGRPRADLLAELVSLRPSIVVAGAHGKTTTSAMIAFCLDRLGLDPA